MGLARLHSSSSLYIAPIAFCPITILVPDVQPLPDVRSHHIPGFNSLDNSPELTLILGTVPSSHLGPSSCRARLSPRAGVLSWAAVEITQSI